MVNHAHARLSALVDGELNHESRDRVLAHLAHCAECRAAVDAERQVKAILAGTPDPAPTEDFQAALFGLGALTSVGATDRTTGTNPTTVTEPTTGTDPTTGIDRTTGTNPTTGAARTAGAVGREPSVVGAAHAVGPLRMRERSSLRTWRRRTGPWPARPPAQPGTRRPGDASAMAMAAGRFPRRMAAGVAGLAAMAGMAAVAAFAAGGDAHPEVTVVPPIRQYSVEHADTVSDLPLSDPGAVTAVLERGLRGRSSGR
ncbi:zf-HC2 domain-containing protein [Actinopolymorpha sp. B11F2]|uniref:anti-sigma factor family protein n=1 Tax=Actinopolymorpha sp. B11F2 TaxID=3160862 RepID=UPI0032E434CF